MANLTRTHKWLRYVPDIGDNRELPAPFYLEVASGLTKVELSEYHEAFGAWAQEKCASEEAFLDSVLRLLAPLVRMGTEPLLVRGRPVPTLRDFLALAMDVMGESPVLEVLKAVRDYNTLGGPKVLFSALPSGGTAGIPTPSTERAGASTGGP